MFEDYTMRNLIKKSIIVVGEIIFLSIAISIFNNLLSYQAAPKIYINGIPSEIPGHYKDGIYKTLARNVLQNTNNIIQIKNNIATVRKDTTSIQYSEELQRYDGSFIVDLDELQQSYLVKIFWSKTNEVTHDEPISVHCPDKKDIIYESSQCRNVYTEQLTSILPVSISVQSPLAEEIAQNYPEPDIDRSLVKIRLYESENYSNKNKTLDYSVVACGDEKIISESRRVVEDWITSSGFNPNDYKLNFVDDCEDN